jgi:hypothetical protein
MQVEKKSLAGQAPYSAARERRIKNWQIFCVGVYIAFWWSSIIWVRPFALAAVVVIGATMLLLLFLVQTSRAQDSMAANKPAASNQSEMTQWIQHPPGTQRVLCSGCSRVLSFASAEIFPKPAPQFKTEGWTRGEGGDLERAHGAKNSVRVEGDYPAGQARLSMVCPCGRGHYKLLKD